MFLTAKEKKRRTPEKFKEKERLQGDKSGSRSKPDGGVERTEPKGKWGSDKGGQKSTSCRPAKVWANNLVRRTNKKKKNSKDRKNALEKILKTTESNSRKRSLEGRLPGNRDVSKKKKN